MRQHVIVLICVALFTCMTSARSTSVKTRQIYRTIRECQCPLRCIRTLRQCLISGMCRLCSLPNYGKRQEDEHDDHLFDGRYDEGHASVLLNM